MTRTAAALSADLTALAELAASRDRGEVAELPRRLAAGLFRVLVAGKANQAKSTLVNAPFGRAVLPTGVVPLTAIPTAVVSGDANRVAVACAHGRFEQSGWDALAHRVTEQGHPRNRPGVAAVGAGRIGEAVRFASALQAEHEPPAAAARAELGARRAAATAFAARLNQHAGEVLTAAAGE